MADTENKGYTVTDRRFFSQSEEEKERLRQESRAAEQARERQEAADAYNRTASQAENALPEITFSSFIISMASSVFMHLGDIPNPETGKTEKNLPLAKQTIDLLGLLRQKTQNNLTVEEEHLFDSLLYDLRLRYVKEVYKTSSAK